MDRATPVILQNLIGVVISDIIDYNWSHTGQIKQIIPQDKLDSCS